ncbi:D-alanyl-D-alanine carboxypeptidase family protein [Alicyclobacillus herbarius]|uniref:D-alanyl-D-alanine carboxypeptidase family protein n=1 Tax=Alicyclobacillus herbarius TaxID=122960 RepID=UPI00138AD621|nr:D-alanyl-D-alanine carboxypeptidase family protein [Alicyclobacillus herbarius]
MKTRKRHRWIWLGVTGLLLAGSTAPFITAQAAGTKAAVPASTTVSAPAKAPTIVAKSAVLMDAASGQILYSKNPNEERAPASTTKLMTMLLVLEAVKHKKAAWNDVVPVTPDAYKIATTPDVSNAYLDPREHFTLRDMMEFIAVLSAADATVAVADDLGGDKQGFVQMMNEEAQRLGLTHTHYMNPDGLSEKNHYTTARDLAVLARYMVTNYPGILNFTKEPRVTVRKNNTWRNTDELLGRYPGLDGLKTGYTSEAGFCFVGTAERNGERLISVVMGDPSDQERFADTKKLLDWGFNNFVEDKVAAAGKTLSQTLFVKNGKSQRLPVAAKNDLVVAVPKGVHGTLELESSSLSAPIAKGASVGTLKYVVNGKMVAEEPVVAAQTDGKASWLARLTRSIGSWFSNLAHRL